MKYLNKHHKGVVRALDKMKRKIRMEISDVKIVRLGNRKVEVYTCFSNR